MAITDWQKIHGDFFGSVRVLVTGGAGFIGSHLCEALVDLGADVRVLDDLSAGNPANLDPARRRAGGGLKLVEASVLDEVALAKISGGCTYVFHLAALGSVPGSVRDPVPYQRVNTGGTLSVLQAARATGVRRVVFASSSSAYGEGPILPKVESMPVRPMSPYAATKVAGEALMCAYAGSYGLDTVSLRYFNIFGPRQNADSAYAAVIAAFAKALIADRQPIIFGDGEQSRDFTFVENAVHASLLAARQAERLGGEVLNVACAKRVTVNELAEVMARMLGKPRLGTVHRDQRPGDVRDSLADLTLAQQAIGYGPIVDFEAGLEPTVRWYESARS